MTCLRPEEAPVVTIEEDALLTELKILENEYADRIGMLAESEAAYDALCANNIKYNPKNYNAGDMEKFRSLVEETRRKINIVRIRLRMETI